MAHKFVLERWIQLKSLHLYMLLSLYLATTIIYLFVFVKKKTIFSVLSKFFLIGSILTHLIFFILYVVKVGYMPVSNLLEALSSIALGIASTYFIIESISKINTTGFIMMGIAFILQLIYELFSKNIKSTNSFFQNPFFMWHTGCAILSYATFMVASVHGALYLLLFKNLKTKKFGTFFKRMPSLEELDKINLTSCVVGLILLAAAIALGYIWKQNIYGSSFHADPKVVISFFLCFLYMFQIFASLRLKWTGRQRSYISLIGFLIILFSLIVGNQITKFHQFM